MNAAARVLLAAVLLYPPAAFTWGPAPTVHRDSPYIRSMLAAPVSRDVEALLTQQVILRMAGETSMAAMLERIAEREMLRRILGDARPAPLSLGATIERGVPRTELAELRQRALLSVLARESAPAGGNAATQTFRNASAVAIASFRSELSLPELRTTLLCTLEGGPALTPGKSAAVDCTESGSPLDAGVRLPQLDVFSVSFVTAGFRMVRGDDSQFDSFRERAEAQLRAARRSDLEAPEPESIFEYDRLAMMVLPPAILPVLLGLIPGLLIGRFAEKPATATGAMTLVGISIVVITLLALALIAPWPRSLGSLEAQWSLIFMLVIGTGVLAVTFVIWALATLGLWLGTLIGARMRRRAPQRGA